MQLPPDSVLASWPEPNYLNPTELRGPGLLFTVCFFFPIAFLSVVLRIITRVRISRNFGLEDIFLIPATLSAFGCTLLTAMGAKKWGWIRHQWDIPTPLEVHNLQMTMALECLLGLSMMFVKVSFLLWLRKTMVRPLWRRISVGLLVLVVINGILFDLLIVFTCTPVSLFWTLSPTPQHCMNERAHLLAGGIFSIMTDLSVLMLALPTVAKLNIYRRQKLLILLLFGGGMIAFGAGIARTWYTWKATSSYDRTWESYPRWITSILELDIALLCAALSGASPFFAHFFPSLLIHRSTKSTNPRLSKRFSVSTIAPPPDFSQDKFAFFEADTPHSPFELRPSIPHPNENKDIIPKPAPVVRSNSRQMLPLSYLSTSTTPSAAESYQSKPTSRHSGHRRSGSIYNKERASGRTSISTFITTRGNARGSDGQTMSTFDFESFPPAPRSDWSWEASTGGTRSERSEWVPEHGNVDGGGFMGDVGERWVRPQDSRDALMQRDEF